MSLNWSIEKVKDWEKLQSDSRQHDITDSLVWGTMRVDLGEITNTNAAEFFARMQASEMVHGPWLQYVGEGDASTNTTVKITLADILRRAGLHTNVSNKSRAQFQRRMGEALMDQADSRKARAIRELADAAQAAAPTPELSYQGDSDPAAERTPNAKLPRHMLENRDKPMAQRTGQAACDQAWHEAE